MWSIDPGFAIALLLWCAIAPGVGFTLGWAAGRAGAIDRLARWFATLAVLGPRSR